MSQASPQRPSASRARRAARSRTLQHLPQLAAGVDVVAMVLSLLLGALLRITWDVFSKPVDSTPASAFTAALFVAVWLVMVGLSGGYSRSVFELGTDEFRRVLRGTVVAAGVVGAALYLADSSVPRGFFVLTFLVGAPVLLLGRVLLRVVVLEARAHGALQHNVLIAGHALSVDEVAAVLHREQRLGYRVSGALVPHAEGHLDETAAGIPVVGTTDRITDVAVESGIDVLFLANGALDSAEQMRGVVWELEHHDVQVVVAPSVSGVSGDRVRIRPVGGLPLMHIDRPRGARATAWGKRLFDVVGSAAVLVAVCPLLAFVALRVRLHDGGPVLFRQRRTGRDGEEFEVLKFRSMVIDAEDRLSVLHAETGHQHGLFKVREDPRITAPGSWLRRYSIDELPQLVNVLRGDMSLVGPRPPLPAEVAQYSPQARRRLHVRPGLTGLWQVSGRSDLSFEEAIRLDLYYVDNWSMLQDLSILLRTVGAVLGSRGAY